MRLKGLHRSTYFGLVSIFCVFAVQKVIRHKLLQSTSTYTTRAQRHDIKQYTSQYKTHYYNCFAALFRDHPGEPVLEENLWTLWCKGRLTEPDTPTIRLGATPSGLTSAHLHHPNFLQAGCPSCRPTNSVEALKAYNTKLIHI